MSPDELGEIAYAAYSNGVGVLWQDLPPEQRLAWAEAGRAVWLRIMGTPMPTESRLVVAISSVKQCSICNFVWSPVMTRCPSCQEPL